MHFILFAALMTQSEAGRSLFQGGGRGGGGGINYNNRNKVIIVFIVVFVLIAIIICFCYVQFTRKFKKWEQQTDEEWLQSGDSLLDPSTQSRDNYAFIDGKYSGHFDDTKFENVPSHFLKETNGDTGNVSLYGNENPSDSVCARFTVLFAMDTVAFMNAPRIRIALRMENVNAMATVRAAQHGVAITEDS